MGITFDPVGRCIYCNSTTAPLSREHIVPFGLGGDLILPQASCAACAKVTGAIEGYCLGKTLGKFRARAGYRTRRKKNRPKKMPLAMYHNGEKITRDIDTNKYPIFIHIPTYPPATMIQQGGSLLSNNSITFNTSILWIEEETARFINDQKVARIEHETSYNPIIFARMIAKIAHAYTVATVGIENFMPLTTGLILGYESNVNFLIGNGQLPEIESSEREYSFCGHQMGDLLVLQVRLFSYSNSPSYHVAVGMLINDKIKSLFKR